MRRKINRKTLQPLLGLLGSYALMACMAACSSEYEDGISPENDRVQIASVSEVAVLNDATTEESTPPAGYYYLGYKSADGDKLKEIKIEKNGVTSEIGLYWASFQKGAAITLSNVGAKADGSVDIPEYTVENPEVKDILWASSDQWQKELDFTLTHRMAKVMVDLELIDMGNVSIEKVFLSNMKAQYSFSRENGNVKVKENGDLFNLALAGASQAWDVLLPPQERTGNMALNVLTSDGTTYSRALPYSMIEELGSGNGSQATKLTFRAGYCLHLKAKVDKTMDYMIDFTGATLVHWKYIGSYPTVAKPAGIYTVSELRDWVGKYNAYIADKTTKNEKALLRYGKLSGDRWTFTLSRNIEIPQGESVGQIGVFYDTLDRLNSYTINITKTDLFGTIDGNAKVEAAIFKTN